MCSSADKECLSDYSSSAKPAGSEGQQSEQSPQLDLDCERRAYVAPRLLAYGDIRAVTLGGSPGTGDSGNYFVQETPG